MNVLPKIMTSIDYCLGWSERWPGRNRIRHRHIVNVTVIRLGNDYHGYPVTSRRLAERALCGAPVVFAPGEFPTDADCSKCQREYQKLQEA